MESSSRKKRLTEDLQRGHWTLGEDGVCVLCQSSSRVSIPWTSGAELSDEDEPSSSISNSGDSKERPEETVAEESRASMWTFNLLCTLSAMSLIFCMSGFLNTGTSCEGGFDLLERRGFSTRTPGGTMKDGGEGCLCLGLGGCRGLLKSLPRFGLGDVSDSFADRLWARSDLGLGDVLGGTLKPFVRSGLWGRWSACTRSALYPSYYIENKPEEGNALEFQLLNPAALVWTTGSAFACSSLGFDFSTLAGGAVWKLCAFFLPYVFGLV